MKMTMLELRRQPSKLLRALEKKEEVTISRRGRNVARVVPVAAPESVSVSGHPAFGMWAENEGLAHPAKAIRRLRRGRFHDL